MSNPIININSRDTMQLNNVKQFFLVRTIYSWASYIFNAYFVTFIFKETGNIFMAIGIMIAEYIGIYFAMLLGNFILGKIGSEKTMRLSFLVMTIAGIIGIFLASAPFSAYYLVVFVRGIGGGFFWAAMHYLEIAGIKDETRGKFYSMSFGISTLFSIVAPALLGYLLVTYSSYIPLYAIVIFISLFGVLFPYRFSLDVDKVLKKEQFVRLFHEVRFSRFTQVKFLISVNWVSKWLIATLIPLIILGDEFNMGIFLSTASLLAAIISIVTRNIKIKRKVSVGSTFLIITSFATLPLVFNFSIFTLSLSWLVAAIASSVIRPVEENLDIRVSAKLSESKKAFTELIVVQETIYLFSRFLVLGFALIMLQYVSVLVFLQFMVALSIAAKALHYIVAVKYLKED